nr:sodium-coupled monocarboxylate transporter 2-like isoform X1 [Halyomorpha halys]
MAPKILHFDWVEYSVFAGMLGVSAMIGIFFGCIKKKGQDTVDGYFLGGKEMGLIPVSISLIFGFISGVTLLGTPSEIYTFGLQYVACLFCLVPNGLITSEVFLPVFYKLQLISVYQYMEMRFNKTVRNVVSFLFMISLFAYIPTVIYAPALALNQVSGTDVYLVSMIIGVICIFYTSIGGLKAVVWTDTFQGTITLLSVIAVAVIGTIKVGGVSYVFQSAIEGERTQLFRMDFDPRIRTTFWSVFFGVSVLWTGGSTINPSAVQRFVSLKTLREAKWAVFNFMFGGLVLFSFSAYMGLVIYAQYKGCDPQTSGMIERPDQILPHFILDVAGNVKGLPGLFLAGVVCAGLSTMSAGLNTVSGTIYEDFIEPLISKKTRETKAAMIMQAIVVVYGILCLLLIMVIDKMGSLIELSNSLGGLTNGTLLGMFVLGMFFPHANSIGTTVGGLVSLLVMGWIVVASTAAIAAGDVVQAVKPVSIDSCPFNITALNVTLPPQEDVFGKSFYLYEVSAFYYSAIGCFIAVVIGLIVSYLTGPTKIEDVDRNLLSPFIYRFLPTTYSTVPTKEAELVNL